MNYYTAPQTILGKFPEKYKDVVIEIVAKEYNLTVDAIKARTRAWESSIPRMVCMHILDSIISIPRPSIPSLFGMNRTSFYHAERAVKNLLDTDKNFRAAYVRMHTRVTHEIERLEGALCESE